jgi:hypothetical protein
MISGDATTTKVTTTAHRKKAAPALQIPATVDGANNEETPTLMQLKGPPEVRTQLNATTKETQSLLQLMGPPVFESWQHGTPDQSLTMSQLKDPPEIKTLQHATTLSTASQLKGNDYNSCVEWAVAAASADGDVKCSDIEGNFKHVDSDRFKKPAAKSNGEFSTKHILTRCKKITGCYLDQMHPLKSNTLEC